MQILKVSENWETEHPGSIVGILAIGNITNLENNSLIENKKTELEKRLRARIHSRTDLINDPVIKAYVSYYKKFKKSYHVLLQIESIAIKGKSIPSVNALVESMFLAELNNRLLTAGHDLDLLEKPIFLESAKGDEKYYLYNGNEQYLKKSDMYVADNLGILSSVIYGPDNRTRITAHTNNAFFVVYAPNGVGEKRVEQHLLNIKANIELFSPDSDLISLELHSA